MKSGNEIVVTLNRIELDHKDVSSIMHKDLDEE